MAGVYIHIPFCTKACHYCNFHFSTTHSLLPQMIVAMQQEIHLKKNIFPTTIDTIYFGGGTPSICNNHQLQQLLQSILQYTKFSEHIEITLEANPNDIVSIQQLKAWKAIGINRLSVGIQSFFDEDLLWMNRAHNSKQAINCLQLIKEAGFTSFNIDLIYGTPTLTNEKWQQNVQIATSNNVPHISCYALTVEENTALEKMIAKNKILPISTQQQANQFELLMEWLPNEGYQHYEISNFCLPNKESQHNTAYWKGKPYIGIGPSAHSFDGKNTRSWNIANNALYIKNLQQQMIFEEKEILTTVQQINECIMLSLRTNNGLDISKFVNIYGNEKANTILALAKNFMETEQLILNNNKLQLTNKGKLFADGIAAHLFFSEH